MQGLQGWKTGNSICFFDTSGLNYSKLSKGRPRLQYSNSSSSNNNNNNNNNNNEVKRYNNEKIM